MSLLNAWAAQHPTDYADWQLDLNGPSVRVEQQFFPIGQEILDLVAVGVDGAHMVSQWILESKKRHALLVIDRPQELLWLFQQSWFMESVQTGRFEVRYWSAAGVHHSSFGHPQLWEAMTRRPVMWWASPGHWEALAHVRAHAEARMDAYYEVHPQGCEGLAHLWALLPHLPRMHHEEVMNHALQGVSLVIAGGGPSLQEALPALQQHRDRILLWGGGAAIPKLAEAGILPDLVCCLDPKEAQQKRLAALQGEQLPLCMTLRSHAPTVVAWHGPLFIGHKGYSGSLEDWIMALLGVPALVEHGAADVVGMLCELAVRAGVARIHFVGRELTFAESPYASLSTSFAHTRTPLPSKQGLRATAPLWLTLADHTARLIRDSPCIQWTTSVEGGLPIVGCSTQPTEEWMLATPLHSPRERFKYLVAAAKPLSCSQEACWRLRERLQHDLEEILQDVESRNPLGSMLLDPAVSLASEMFRWESARELSWKSSLAARLQSLWT